MSGAGLHWGSAAGLVLGIPFIVWGVVGLIRAAAIPADRRPLPLWVSAGRSVALALVGLLLVDPQWTHKSRVPRENELTVLVDRSASASLPAGDDGLTRSATYERYLTGTEREWLRELERTYRVEVLTVGDSVGRWESRDKGSESRRSTLNAALPDLADRMKGRAWSGVVLFSDGRATDPARQPADWGTVGLPPVYTVAPPGPPAQPDVALQQVVVSTAPFEKAAVTVVADVLATHAKGDTVRLRLERPDGSEVLAETKSIRDDSERLSFRFQPPDVPPGLSHYRLAASLERPDGTPRDEVTDRNNRRHVLVDRQGGQHRLLYVAGRPNWEYKFLSRSLQTDPELVLTGMIRVAKRAPKFDWRARGRDDRNPLFAKTGDDDASSSDEPVIVRLNTAKPDELAAGFPRLAEDLFPFELLILDDVEAGFFTPDQLELIEDYVSRRGGALLMLGGQESFREGNYGGTPLADLLPAVLRTRTPVAAGSGPARWELTESGWLEPALRLFTEETADRQRLAEMPAFRVVNQFGGLKPGAELLAEVVDSDGTRRPALAAQSYGLGYAAGMFVGDLYRWQLAQTDEQRQAGLLEQAWRQWVRRMIVNVPKRHEIDRADDGVGPQGLVRLTILCRDRAFDPALAARVTLRVTFPDGSARAVATQPVLETPGLFEALVPVTEDGFHRASAEITVAEDDVATAEFGWVEDPDAEEFASLSPDEVWLERLAAQTGGAVIKPQELTGLPARLAQTPVARERVQVTALVRQPWAFAFIVAGLLTEWWIRRKRGLR